MLKSKLLDRSLMVALAFLLAVFSFSIVAPVNAQAQEVVFKWDPSVGFVLPAYGTSVTFGNTAYFTALGWDQWNASTIYFFNAMLEGDDAPLSFVGVSVVNANATIYSFSRDGAFRVTLYAPSGAVSTLVLKGVPKPKAVVVGGRAVKEGEFLTTLQDFTTAQPPSVLWDPATSTLMVKVLHHSPEDVVVAWQAVTVTETATVTTTERVWNPIDITQSIGVGIAALFLALMGVILAVVIAELTRLFRTASPEPMVET